MMVDYIPCADSSTVKKCARKIPWLPFLLVLACVCQPVLAEEGIFNDERNSGFNNRWVEPNNTSAHEIGLSKGAAKPSFVPAHHVIHWRWDKTVFSYSNYSWGMQWRGCNEPIDFLSILYMDRPPAEMTLEYYKNFTRRAEQVALKFELILADDDFSGKAINVRFDMVGDIPSEDVNILEHLYSHDHPHPPITIYPKAPNLGLEKKRPYEVIINFIDFAFLEQGLDLTKMKQIVFSIPKDGPKKGDIFLYNIRIE
ncbi:MAG: hypothetical protein HW380_2944 [Magnetococcales bacterium]|nr:hypothetical protein [Magnetococcales bacterium]